MVPVICHLCNMSSQTGVVPSSLKYTLVHHHIEKPTLDPEVTNNLVLFRCCHYQYQNIWSISA